MSSRSTRLRQLSHVALGMAIGAATYSLLPALPAGAGDCLPAGPQAAGSAAWQGFLRSTDYETTDEAGRSWIP